MKKLAIIGAGALGQLIAHHAVHTDFNIEGFYCDFQEEGAVVDGYNVLGKLDKIQSDFQRGRFTHLVLGIGYNNMPLRKSVFESFYPHVEFANIIHPSSYVDRSCKLGTGIFVLPNCALDRNVQLGNNVLLNISCTIAHDTQIGDHSFLSPGVCIAGFTRVGACCTIGIGSNIIDCIDLCDYVQTAGGSVVTKTLTESGLYAGVPAVLKRRRELQ